MRPRRTSLPAVLPAGALALLLALLPAAAGCTSDLMDDDADGTAGGAAASQAAPAPGRHSGLPEPCGAVEEDRLRELLPEAGPEELTGEPALTFDTGRRAACSWRSPGETGTRELSVDFLRVVSYDPAVSDDDQAAADFALRAAERGIPPASDEDTTAEDDDDDGDDDATGEDTGEDTGADTGTGTDGGPGTGGDTGTDTGGEDGTAAAGAATAGTTAGSSGITSPGGELAPRALDGIGHAAFIDDRLTPTASGSRRDIVLTFHNANVIVTISYRETTGEAGAEPDSAVLQERVQNLARQLADRLEE
ncbi:hypothetical protein [Streptomyces sp. YIM 98790]|uniref:hypothetical protein n=1 Tax=Streptomyces sp. YIM 98790 TaxID=2689077 RepID=UPI00140A3F4F|nr:hypothetical protein [Streptomyces sp. YIM 98790]